MARSIKKGPFVDQHLMGKVAAAQESGGRQVIKTWSRRSTILPDFLGLTFTVQTERSSFLSTSLRTWSATSWASSHLLDLLRPCGR